MNVLKPEKNTCHMLLKPGELMLKSKPVRRTFTYRLINNLWDAIRESEHHQGPTRIKREQASVAIETSHPGIVDNIRNVFGITSIAHVERLDTTNLETIIAAGVDRFKDLVTGKRFAVRCKRSGKTAFSSNDVNVALGSALHAFSAGVDLSHPEVVCRLDIHSDSVKFYTDVTPAFGGLPIGTQGKAVALISGGIDSPVAAWYGLKRGLEVHYLFCSLGGPLQHWGPSASAWILANRWSYGYQPTLHIADFNQLLQEFKEVDSRYRNILLKRYLYRAADHLANHIGADAIITGEALGQVSSQTLSNLRTITGVTDKLIMRPLVGFDKTEIIARAREIGTLDISEKVPEFCNVAVRHPRTKSKAWELEDLEQSIDPAVVSAAVGQWDRRFLKAMKAPEAPTDPILEQRPVGSWCVWIENPEIPGDPPDSLSVDQVVHVLDLRKFINSYERPGVLLFCCAQSRMSIDAAIFAREKGLDAYRLK